MALKVTIDGTYCLAGKTGIGEYVYNLISAINNYGNPDISYRFFYNCILKKKYDIPHPFKPAYKNIFAPLPRRWLDKLWNSSIPADFMLGFPDLFINTGLHIPLKINARVISIIYDLSFLIDDVTYSTDEKKNLDYKIKKILKVSDIILTCSESTKKDIIKFYSYPVNKIHTIYGALSENMPGGEEIGNQVVSSRLSDIFEKAGLDLKNKESLPFFLFVGTIEKRKNLNILPDAVKLLNRDFKIIIAGKKGNAYPELTEKIKRMGLTGSFIFTDYISGNEKWFLYQNCSAVLYPSIYEGFGFPALEALYFGKPIITTRKGSIPEIAGNCAIYIEPDDYKSLAEKMDLIVKNKYHIPSNAIKEQLEFFSWKKNIIELERLALL